MDLEKEAFVDKEELREEVPKKGEPPATLILCCFSHLLVVWVTLCAVKFSCSYFLSKSITTNHVPYSTIAFMNFTVFDINTHLSAKWNLSIRVPENLPGSYICLQGDFQASLLYKNITIATSPPRSYNNLLFHWPQLLKVSGDVSEEDINGAIGKNIVNDIKERSEVRLGLRLFLPDCRENKAGTMKFACDEVKMKFESSYEQKITSTVVGYPNCLYDDH
ncbi:hypothetical protein ISN45_At03g053750 [Arabidopsis thaliana x Arabidopsis arenosa]|uniref:Uncharacterized protein n=3 Tax=Arabidopsis TaxID=3701 RepID=A0A178VJE7_ARATH|nr:hypothetical protein ISN45_At03g053750 [Arabidopsis thaliana x Arabidopsis arenosa]KAG7635136.1 hypothetical protein ISN44_As03g052590 [Arabidopsis suecica]OAP05996.1 hypothetical protein AXX17_AT3G55080 [Arabidopsis thaliana]